MRRNCHRYSKNKKRDSTGYTNRLYDTIYHINIKFRRMTIAVKCNHKYYTQYAYNSGKKT